MVCKTCNAEIPKKATRCPECGRAVVKPQKNLYPIAIAGAVISFVGGFFPAIQNADASKKFNPAYGFMNYEQPVLWYLFIALLTASVILCAVKYEKISIATTVLAAVVYAIVYNNICNRHGAPGMQNGLAGALVILGTIVGVAGCFLDVNKNAAERKRRSGEID